MISICLKSNNIHSLNYLENCLDQITFPQIYYSQKKFNIYKNLIIHYTGNDLDKFYDIFSNILSKYIIENYEKSFINQQLKFDFFYFSTDEKKMIQTTTIQNLNSKLNKKQKNSIINNCIKSYFLEHSSCVLDGFINFRLFNYKNFINLILENTINDYILKKEYAEYVNLLYEYISIQEPQSENIHLMPESPGRKKRFLRSGRL